MSWESCWLPELWETRPWSKEGAEAPSSDLASIQWTGMQLQECLAQYLSLHDIDALADAGGHAEKLLKTAHLVQHLQHPHLQGPSAREVEAAEKDPLDALRHQWNTEFVGERAPLVAAAFHLWPWFACSLFVGFEGPALPEIQIEPRRALRHIQDVIFRNLDATLLFIRRSFRNGSDDGALLRHLLHDRGWRPSILRTERLGERIPDLCAIDGIAAEVVALSEANHGIHYWMGAIHRHYFERGATGYLVDEDRAGFIRRTASRLGMAQMTVLFKDFDGKFYPLKGIGDDAWRASIDAVLPCQTWASLEERLLGSASEDHEASTHFWNLVTACYTDRAVGTKFEEIRQSTISGLETLNVEPSGRATGLFLQGFELRKWPPGPLRVELENLPKSIPDFSSDDWWELGAKRELVERSLQVDSCESHHWWAWDDMVVSQKCGDDKCNARPLPESSTESGYLLDMLLRRRTERLTRTSFFFGLEKVFSAKTKSGGGDSNSGSSEELTAFVGGTLLGLERPGVPFCLRRFHVVASHLRGPAMVLAAAARGGARLEQEKAKISRDKMFNERVKSLLGVFDSGSDEAVTRLPPYHDPYHTHALGGMILPTGFPLPPDDVSGKVLFALGGPNVGFNEIGGLASASDGSYYYADLKPQSDYLVDAFNWLLGDHQIRVHVRSGRDEPKIALPTRPGLRSVVAVCGFVHAVNQNFREHRSRVNEICINDAGEKAQFILKFEPPLLDDDLQVFCGPGLTTGLTACGSPYRRLHDVFFCGCGAVFEAVGLQRSTIAAKFCSPVFGMRVEVKIDKSALIVSWENNVNRTF